MARKGSGRGSGRRLSSPYLDSARNRRLADFALAATPERVDAYVEPFLDGGAVAVAMMQRHPDASFRLNALQPEVAEVWSVVRDDVEPFLDEVARSAGRHGPEFFTETRDLPPAAIEALTPAARAARFVYFRGASRSHPVTGPLQRFDGALYGRDSIAFDETNVRGLSALLRGTDVRFSSESLFGVLPVVREDDLVYLDAPFGAPGGSGAGTSTGSAAGTGAGTNAGVNGGLEREVRSFVNAVAAKGALLLAPGGRHPDADAGTFAAWPGFSRLDDPDDEQPLWGNTLLLRALRREGHRA
ncbi:DNA adenine methylase [Herbiconiux daphne]|uniref:DNA adenine methylase n=1 Tax=Herbiconiux daphne TaxID=2970914 RepID=A0ABT2GZL0_9MICO|nr:DNA adenine methylase [Herbiconiux daphne]MCS5733401.1 DNA adenine methylase [Herbiconiux daphne]